MKLFLILLCTFCSMALAQDITVKPGSDEWRELFDPPFTKPTELPTDSTIRKQLFDLLRPQIELESKKHGIRFKGELKAFKNWAYFVGKTLDHEGEAIRFPEMDNTETAALWLRTREGWKLVDWGVGFSDPLPWIWPERYGVPRQLVGLK